MEVVLDGGSILCRLRALVCSASLLEDPSSTPVPPLSLILLPSSSSDLERVAGMRLKRGSRNEGVLFAIDEVELAISVD